MYIATNESQIGGRGIVNIMPQGIRKRMCGISLEGAQEIRLCSGKPFSIRYSDGWYYLSKNSVISDCVTNALILSRKDMEEILERVSKSSLYSVRDEIRNGYITIEGGHRVGLAGTAVTANNEVEFIKSISAMNIRLANEVIGASDCIMNYICENGIKSTLLVSPPCAGKTTMLRDIARSLSYMGTSVAIADERCEIAAMYNGVSSFDLGNMAVVLDNCPKADAMLMLLRSMSPDVIITDEIGTLRDAEAIRNIMNSGVAVMASIHGRDIRQLMNREEIDRLAGFFDLIVVMSNRKSIGCVEEIIYNA